MRVRCIPAMLLVPGTHFQCFWRKEAIRFMRRSKCVSAGGSNWDEFWSSSHQEPEATPKCGCPGGLSCVPTVSNRFSFPQIYSKHFPVFLKCYLYCMKTRKTPNPANIYLRCSSNCYCTKNWEKTNNKRYSQSCNFPQHFSCSMLRAIKRSQCRNECEFTLVWHWGRTRG